MRIIDQGMIATPRDIMKLNIIDWHRTNGIWPGPAEALDSAAAWLVGLSYYSIVDIDADRAPGLLGWAGWDHVGAHPYAGRLFWNWFCYHRLGEIKFVDEPDFYGVFKDRKGSVRFVGDIQRASVSCFVLSIGKLFAGELWLSFLDGKRLVIIELLYSPADLWAEMITGDSYKTALEPLKVKPAIHQTRFNLLDRLDHTV